MHSANVLDQQQGSSLSPFFHPTGGANQTQSGTNLVKKDSTIRGKIPTQFSNGQNNQKGEGITLLPKTPEAVRQVKGNSQELTSLGRLSGIMRYTPNGLEKYIGQITPRKSAQDLSNIQKKKKKSGFYQAIKLRKLGIKWMNMTSFMRYKKLIFSHFSLIDDKSTIYSQQNLPNRISVSGIQNKGKGARIFRKLLCWKRNSDGKDKISDKAGEIQHGYEQKLKEQIILNNLLWLDDLFKFIPVISPTGTFKFFWDILVLVAIISFMFMIPLEFTFSLGLEQMFNVIYLRVCISILIADFILSWNFGYFEKGLPITIRSHVINNYLQKGLIIDVCSSLFLFVDILFRYKEQSNSYFHLLFILKINSIKVIFKKIEERFHLTPQITQISSLIKLLFLILTVSHILGCTWVIVAHKEIDSGQNSWIQKVSYDPTDWFAQYQCAYYFSTVTMITVGYGDFAPVNNVERMVDIVAMLISCGVFAYSINAIGEIFAVINLKKNKIKNDLFAISNFMSKKSINQQLQYEVREFLEFQWKISSDRDHQKEAALIKQLSGSLREKLLVETYKLVLTQYKIFSQNFSEEFMISLIDIIEEHTIRPDEIVISELGEQQSDLYFVENGKIIIYADENGEKIIKIYSKGDPFGEIAFFTGQPNTLNIKAVEHSILLCINRKKFISLIQNFPIDYEVFCNMKDCLIYQKDFSQICLKCYSCGSNTHTVGQCPSIHLVLNNVQVINRMLKQEFGERRSIERKTKKFPSLILLEYVSRQAEKYIDTNTEDIYNYIDLYFENEEDLERPQNSQQMDEQDEAISPYLGPKESLQICEIAQEGQNNYENTSNSLIEASPTVQSALKEAGLSGLGLLDQLTHASMQNHLNSISMVQGHGEMKNIVNSKEFAKVNSSINPFLGLSDLDTNNEIRQKKSLSSQSQSVGKLAFSQISQKTSNLNAVQAQSPLRKKDRSLMSQVTMPSQLTNQMRFDKGGTPSIFPNQQAESINQKALFQQATKNLNNGNNSQINNVSSIQQIEGQQPDSALTNQRTNILQPSNGQGNNSIFHNKGRKITQVLNKAKMQVLVDEIAKVVAQNRDQEVNHPNVEAEEEFDKQRNYNFYMPHNNLSSVLEYIRFRQKNIKSTKASARFISNSKNNIFESNRKLTAVQTNIIQNPQNFALIRRFEQTNLPSIQEKKRRETFINKNRRSKKLATTHIQKLVLKYEEISNQVPQNPDSQSDIITPSNKNFNQGDNKDQSSSSNGSIVKDLALKYHLDQPISKDHQQGLQIFQFPPDHLESMFSNEQMDEEQPHDNKSLSCYQHLQSYIYRKDRFLGLSGSQRMAQNDFCSREEVWGNQDTAQHHSFIKSAFDPEINLQPEFQFSSIKFLQQEDINSSSSSIPSTSRNIVPLEAILPKLANKNYKCEELSPFQTNTASFTVTQHNCDSKNAQSLTFKQNTEQLEDSQFI